MTMEGTTPVALDEANVRFVNDFHVETVGDLRAAAGLITLYQSGDATRVYSQIRLGGTLDLSSQRMVPLGKTFYLVSWNATATDNKSVVIRLMVTARHGVLFPRIFFTKDSVYLYNNVYSHEFSIPIEIPALSIIKCYCKPVTAGAYVTANWNGWIEE